MTMSDGVSRRTVLKTGAAATAAGNLGQQTSRHDLMPGLGTEVSLRLQAIPAVQGIERLTRLDTQTPGFMRILRVRRRFRLRECSR
ncbi:twin-arginine translocation signal domain-containing protein [Tistrella mobilis]|jgi:hypothetical protein|uniref:twin-arginine translocation signal domain-containing protein n=1 Tax=Tistrella mobilis TaxID=171437 RepID=UPI0035566073